MFQIRGLHLASYQVGKERLALYLRALVRLVRFHVNTDMDAPLRSPVRVMLSGTRYLSPSKMTPTKKNCKSLLLKVLLQYVSQKMRGYYLR